MLVTDDQRFVELLTRWISGECTLNDERELLALAADDAFRREALAGLWSAPEQDWQGILDTLRGKIQKKSLPIRVKRFNFMYRLAAVAAVMGGLVVAVWLLNQRKETTNEVPIAQTQAPSGIQDGLATELSENENTTAIRPSGKAGSRLPAGAVADQGKSIREENTEKQTLKSEEIASAAPEPVSAKPVVPATSKDDEMAAEALQSDMTPASAGAPAEQKMPKISEPQKARSMDAAKAKKQQAGKNAVPEAARPQEGWAAFNERLKSDLILPTDVREGRISGKVQLQFTINANGKAENIQVVRALSPECDQEAIRFVRETRWMKSPDNNLVRAEIPFVQR